MAIIKNLFKIEFNQDDILNMRVRDGILAIGYYFYYLILIFAFGLLMFRSGLYPRLNSLIGQSYMFLFLFYIPITVVSLLPIFLIIRFRKQELSSLGIVKTDLIRSILIGILFSLPFVIPNLIDGIVQHYPIVKLSDLIWMFLYYFISIGLVEELGFRGFIQTRISGVVKDKWAGILLVGVMFGLIHIPFQMLKANLSLFQFIQQDYIHLLLTVALHLYFVYIYTRYNNIWASITTHALIDFIPSIFIY